MQPIQENEETKGVWGLLPGVIKEAITQAPGMAQFYSIIGKVLTRFGPKFTVWKGMALGISMFTLACMKPAACARLTGKMLSWFPATLMAGVEIFLEEFMNELLGGGGEVRCPSECYGSTSAPASKDAHPPAPTTSQWWPLFTTFFATLRGSRHFGGNHDR